MDRLPGAVQMMAKAAQDAGLTVNGTASELEDLMKKGKLMSADVLPFFAKRLQEFANANGALESKLNSNRVAMNRLKSSYEITANMFFESGFGEGLTDTFNTLAETLKDLNPMFRVLGRVIGIVFKALTFGIRLLAAPLNFLFTQIERLTNLFDDWVLGIPIALGAIAISLRSLTSAAAIFGVSLNAAFLPVLTTIAAVLVALVAVEDFFRSFDPNYDTVLKRVDKVQSSFKNKSAFGLPSNQTAIDALKSMYNSRTSSREQAISFDSIDPKLIQSRGGTVIQKFEVNINGAQDPAAIRREMEAYAAMFMK